MLAFYRNQRFQDCPLDADGDMLFYQWRIARGHDGDNFELGITRQFILGGDAEEENFWRLSLTFKFVVSETLRTIISGHKWCPRPRPQAVDYFERFVRESEAYRAICDLEATGVDLEYFNAG